jgi:uncharacterized protein (TIGR03437 family)
MSPPFDVVLDTWAPALDVSKYYLGLTRDVVERALPNGSFARWTCLPGATPKAGGLARIYANGLGPTEPVVLTGMAAPSAPLARTLSNPRVMVGEQDAEVVESVLAPGEVGVYRVTFKVPTGEGLCALRLSIGGSAVEAGSYGVGSSIYHANGGLFLEGGLAPTTPGLGFEGPGAAESIVTVFGCGASLGAGEQISTADPRNPSTILNGTSIKVKDSQGVERVAQLRLLDTTVAPSTFPFSTNRADYIIPAGTANGKATVNLTTGGGTVITGNLDIKTVTPRFIQLWSGVPAAAIIRVRDGKLIPEPVYQINPFGYGYNVPIDMGPETDETFLMIMGTGWRNRSSLTNLTITGFSARGSRLDLPIEYAGPQPDFSGIDQLNLRLPRSLAGQGQVMFTISIDGTKTSFGLIFK